MSGRPDPSLAGGADRVVLLRGVNVSGANRLTMETFRRLLAGLGLAAVQSHIQSGNAVFSGGPPDAQLAPMIREAVLAAAGFAPGVFLRRAEDLRAALDHPFGAAAEAARIHAVFLADADADAVFDEGRLNAARTDEAWELRSGLLLLHTPSGMGRSKVAKMLPLVLKTPQTARNLKTVAALAALLASRSREDGAG